MMYRSKEDLIAALVFSTDVVLDIGFVGQGTRADRRDWPHRLIQERAKEVYGIDLEIPDNLKGNPRYKEASAEGFSFDTKFSLIFAGDLIEHLSNPGLFLDRCRMHLAPGGRLVLTTPNAFNLFNLAEKLSKYEPTVNSDHTCYFNTKVLRTLLQKNNYKVLEMSYLYTLGKLHRESFKKKILNTLYSICSRTTDKFGETIVCVTQPV
jgi:2-polyprenyl-3-methyl-5-hydroxy-6-metoxy-1,4-benzoquinol methylase